MVERVDRLAVAPKVGCFYMVPTVRWKAYGMVSDWPVRGPIHEDAEHLDFPQMHYHFDHRFFTAREASHIFDSYREPEISAAAKVCTEFRHSAPPGWEGLPRTPTWQKRRCAREELRWPGDRVQQNFRDMHASFVGQQCARSATGWICPHRNFRLGSIAAKDGVIVCPLHGLRIDAESGRVLSGHPSILAKKDRMGGGK